MYMKPIIPCIDPTSLHMIKMEMKNNLKIYDKDSQLILDEEYRIIKRDEKNKWVEKWGFANGKPLTFHKRK